MAIDDTIKTLTKIYHSIDRGIPKTAASPDALLDHLNDLYSESADELESRELFAYDDVGSPSITLTVRIDVEFDLKRVMENMRTRLHATQHYQADEIGNTGIVWSHGRYDFVYDDDSGLLRISHKYSHERGDTKSVLSVTKKMINYTKDYLEEVKKSTEESTGTPETE
ncbi:MAG: hypothetical protein ACFFC7_31990 [Candidatus Hermodarchaeota archaeon]